jgi:hypothetical protein
MASLLLNTHGERRALSANANVGAATVATACSLQYHKFHVECENNSLYLHDFLGPQISLSFRVYLDPLG